MCRDRGYEYNTVASFILLVIQQTLVEHILVSTVQKPEPSKTKQLLPSGRALSSKGRKWM